MLYPPNHEETYIERNLREALAALHVDAQPQVYFSPYTVDFYLPVARLALEADGCMVHECPICAYDFSTTDWGYNAVHEKRKHRDAHLMKNFHLPVAHLWGHDLQTSECALAAVRMPCCGMACM